MISRYTTAFQFLTAIPLFKARRFEDAELARSMAAFPLVGATLGGLLVGAHYLLGRHLPPLFEAVMLVGLLAFATGGFHLDGLADTVDGLAGGWTKERALEIMKDSRIGSMGAIALCLVLLAKVSAFAAFAPETLWKALLVAPAAARGAVVFLAWKSPYARATPGLGSPYTEHLDGVTVAAAFVLSGAVSAVAGWIGIAAWAATWAWAGAHKLWFKGKLGGITGDCLGFAEETGEVLVLVVLLLGRNQLWSA
jgi:adenosylcobinamide-GDP ribazoletransferase